MYGVVDGVALRTYSTYAVSGRATNINFMSSDYAAIGNGSYRKVVKAYYGGNAKMAPMVSHIASSKDSAKQLAELEKNAKRATEAMDAFRKATANENNMETLLEKAKQFVEDYNAMLESAEEISSKSVRNAVENMTDATAISKKSLEKMGIQVEEDNTLSINEEAFLGTDLDIVSKMLTQKGYFGYQIDVQASRIGYMARREMLKSATYNNAGLYSNNYNYSYSNYI